MAVRLDPVIESAIGRVARGHPATAFNVNYADADGQDLALALRDVLLGAGWSQLSAASPAPGFNRRGIIVWVPPERRRVADELARAIGPAFAVQVVERTDGGPVALTVGVATWADARGARAEG